MQTTADLIEEKRHRMQFHGDTVDIAWMDRLLEAYWADIVDAKVSSFDLGILHTRKKVEEALSDGNLRKKKVPSTDKPQTPV